MSLLVNKAHVEPCEYFSVSSACLENLSVTAYLILPLIFFFCVCFLFVVGVLHAAMCSTYKAIQKKTSSAEFFYFYYFLFSAVSLLAVGLRLLSAPES